MDIHNVLSGIRDAVAGVKDVAGRPIHCSAYVPLSVVDPAFYVREYTIEPHATFKGRWSLTATCVLLVSASTSDVGQKRLATFLSRDGDPSVYAALMAARGAPGERALGGAADDLAVERMGPPRIYEVASVPYYGAEIVVSVVGSPEA